MNQANGDFGLPPVEAKVDLKVAPEGETPDERMARLQQLADLAIGQESDAEIVERLVAEARAKRAAALLPMDTAGFPAEYVKVKLFEGSGENDLTYVPLSLNGFCIKVPRGADVILPKVFVTECLDHAVETKVTPIRDRNGVSSGYSLRSAHRFPYSVIGAATPEEYQTFQREQRALATQQLQAAAA